ncbi:MAG: hypothetical protein ACSHYB_02875 [Roseibacillus sp.]
MKSSKRLERRIAEESAATMQQLALALANEKLTIAFPDGPDRESSASGGYSTLGSEFEVLTADTIYWYDSVDRSVVKKIAAELDELPEIRKWISNGKHLNQNRKIEFRVTGTTDRPMMKLLFLCNNLPAGEVENEGFMKNEWEN